MLSASWRGPPRRPGRGATALYLSPTKALAADQLARMQAMAVPGVRAATYDGDTPPEERRWIRDHANFVLTNPDLLHHSLLPGHERWAPFLRALRYVVIDECHIYRGVFGSHLAAVLRRLRRVCARYGAHPTFVLASATVRDPGAARLPPRRYAGRAGHRGRLAARGDDLRDVGAGPARARATAVARPRPRRPTCWPSWCSSGVQTVAFAQSRAGVEALATSARRHAAREVRPGWEVPSRHTAAVICPRSGASSSARLRAGSIVGLAATNALELGIDVSGLDAVLLAGWPGTRALVVAAGRPRRVGRARGRWRCSSPPTTRSTPTSCTTPRWSSGSPSRPPSSTRTTPTCWARTWPPPRPSCR